MADKLTPEQEAQRATWQYRAILATRGNQTMMGCVVQAILGRAASNPPRLGLTAVISEDGYVFTNMVDRHGRLHGAGPEAVFPPLCLGSVAGLVGEFRALADQLKLEDVDREAMFTELRKWITADFRAILDPDDEIRRSV